MASDSESDVHQELRHRVQFIAGAIAQQGEARHAGRSAICGIPDLAAPCVVSHAHMRNSISSAVAAICNMLGVAYYHVPRIVYATGVAHVAAFALRTVTCVT